jgi:hypothetical protein
MAQDGSKPGRSWSDEELAQLRSMSDQGAEPALIAAALGRSVKAIRTKYY